MAEEFFVENMDIGMRVDRFLAQKYTNLTRGEIARMLRSGHIVVDGAQAKPSFVLRGGEHIFMSERREKVESVIPNHGLSICIVEDMRDFLVVDKARGIQVHPSHREKENTLVNALVARYPHITTVGDDIMRPGIVHRLDKDTTGLMVVAKSQRAFMALKKAFQEKRVYKVYHALVWGNVRGDEGVVDAPIARATSYTKQKIAFGKYVGDAKDARTRYRVVARYDVCGGEVSLVELYPETGRMHQIRVHMAHIGHPLVCDVRYYRKTEQRLPIPLPKTCDPSTFYLHAKELNFTLFDKKYHFTSEYPERFHCAVDFLKKGNI